MMDAKELFDTIIGYVNRRFYQKREYLFESSGAVSRLMPILTNAAGKVDASMIEPSVRHVTSETLIVPANHTLVLDHLVLEDGASLDVESGGALLLLG